jgi:SpoVK/Ycf46/Vps4 family AAA+-type ATPase
MKKLPFNKILYSFYYCIPKKDSGTKSIPLGNKCAQVVRKNLRDQWQMSYPVSPNGDARNLLLIENPQLFCFGEERRAAALKGGLFLNWTAKHVVSQITWRSILIEKMNFGFFSQFERGLSLVGKQKKESSKNWLLQQKKVSCYWLLPFFGFVGLMNFDHSFISLQRPLAEASHFGNLPGHWRVRSMQRSCIQSEICWGCAGCISFSLSKLMPKNKKDNLGSPSKVVSVPKNRALRANGSSAALKLNVIISYCCSNKFGFLPRREGNLGNLGNLGTFLCMSLRQPYLSGWLLASTFIFAGDSWQWGEYLQADGTNVVMRLSKDCRPAPNCPNCPPFGAAESPAGLLSPSPEGGEASYYRKGAIWAYTGDHIFAEATPLGSSSPRDLPMQSSAPKMGYLKKFFAVPRSPIGWGLEKNRSYCKSNVPFNGEGLISLEEKKLLINYLRNISKYKFLPRRSRGEKNFGLFLPKSLGCLLQQDLNRSVAKRIVRGSFSNLHGIAMHSPKGYAAGVSALLICPPGHISDADVSNVGEKLRIQITPKSLIKNQRFFKNGCPLKRFGSKARSLPDCLRNPPNQRSGHIEQTQLNLLEIAEATQISDWESTSFAPRSLIWAHVVSKEKKQKIQRLKRQRRQIGKKKKRKRISPRSLWLRFNLYDRFLKKLPRSPIGWSSYSPKGHWHVPFGPSGYGHPFPSRQRGCFSKGERNTPSALLIEKNFSKDQRLAEKGYTCNLLRGPVRSNWPLKGAICSTLTLPQLQELRQIRDMLGKKANFFDYSLLEKKAVPLLLKQGASYILKRLRNFGHPFPKQEIKVGWGRDMAKPCWVLNKLNLASPSPGELKGTPSQELLEFFLPVQSYGSADPLANRYKIMQALYGPIFTWTRELKRDDKKWNQTKKVTHNLPKIVNRLFNIKSFSPLPLMGAARVDNPRKRDWGALALRGDSRTRDTYFGVLPKGPSFLNSLKGGQHDCSPAGDPNQAVLSRKVKKVSVLINLPRSLLNFKQKEEKIGYLIIRCAPQGNFQCCLPGNLGNLGVGRLGNFFEGNASPSENISPRSLSSPPLRGGRAIRDMLAPLCCAVNIREMLTGSLGLAPHTAQNTLFSCWWKLPSQLACSYVPFIAPNIFTLRKLRGRVLYPSRLLHAVRGLPCFSKRLPREPRSLSLPSRVADSETSRLRGLIILFFFLSVSLLHFCAFFSLLSIPQIRCILKTYFLVLYKIVNKLSKKSLVVLSFKIFKNSYQACVSAGFSLLVGAVGIILPSPLITPWVPRTPLRSFFSKIRSPLKKYGSNSIRYAGGRTLYYLENPPYRVADRPAIRDLQPKFFFSYLRGCNQKSLLLPLQQGVGRLAGGTWNLGDYVLTLLPSGPKGFGRALPKISDLGEKILFYLMCNVISTMALVDLCFKFFLSFSIKPAEEFVDYIAKAFLIEWSSDLATIVPDQLENSISRFNIKVTSVRNLGPFGFLLQQRFWHFFEVVFEILNQPDIFLVRRKKKTFFFWDLWANLLFRKAHFARRAKVAGDSQLEGGVEGIMLLILAPPAVCPVTAPLRERDYVVLSASRHKALPASASHFRQVSSCNQRLLGFSPQGDLCLNTPTCKALGELRLGERGQILAAYSDVVAAPLMNIYSGVLIQQIAKNVLIIGTKKTFKTQLMRAIAGETESKIRVENLNRYHLVLNGIPIGIRLLKDVFDAILIESPCLFLLEEIHAIGERRGAFVPEAETLFDDIFQKNQILYFLSRHKFRYYKKPFGSSLLMRSAAEAAPNIKRTSRDATVVKKEAFNQRSEAATLSATREQENSAVNTKEGVSARETNASLLKKRAASADLLKQPLAPTGGLLQQSRISSLLGEPREKQLSPFGFSAGDSARQPKGESFFISGTSVADRDLPRSLLQVAEETIHFSSGASPKETPKKDSVRPLEGILKFSNNKQREGATSIFDLPNGGDKRVSELPWFGIPLDQLPNLGSIADALGESYSIRAKCLLLVEKAADNMHVKVNIVIDFLIIMDSVKSTTGFVVFATTHLPSILDPALRRPGRFDETIMLQSSRCCCKMNLPSYFSRSPIAALPILKKTKGKVVSIRDMRDHAALLHKRKARRRNVNSWSPCSESQGYTAGGPFLALTRRAEAASSLYNFRARSQQISDCSLLPPQHSALFNVVALARRAKAASLLNIAPRSLSSPNGRGIFQSFRWFENYKRSEKDSQNHGRLRGLISQKGKMQLHLNQKKKKKLYNFSVLSQLASSSRWLKQPLSPDYVALPYSPKGYADLGAAAPLKRLRALPRRGDIVLRDPTLFIRAEVGNALLVDAKYFSPVSCRERAADIVKSTYSQKILNRHRVHLTTSWFNGQLPEHNKESTFASDIEWRLQEFLPIRYFFYQSRTRKKRGQLYNPKGYGDYVVGVLIDSPDSEMFYHPKQQTWVLC